MNWIELEKTSGTVYNGIRVRDKYITISSSLRHLMGDPDYAILFYDKELSAIGLKVGDETNGRRFITSSKTHLAASLPKDLPRGRYSFVEEKDGIFICSHPKSPNI